ncbi:MAG: diacylglycerol kinase [Anaerorhabdus sp.]
MKKKFGAAFQGLGQALKSKSFQIQMVLACVALVASFILNFSYTENLILGLCIGLVLSLEIINEALEKLCDHVTKEWHEDIKVIKDLAAAAVLVASIACLILGVMMVMRHL